MAIGLLALASGVLTAPVLAETPQIVTDEKDLSPENIEESPVFQRWREKVPNILEDIRHEPSFSTRWRLGYSQFPSNDDAGGINLGIEDVFLGKTGLTLSADFKGSFNGDRLAEIPVGAGLENLKWEVIVLMP